MSLLQTIRFSIRTAGLDQISRWRPSRVERRQARRLRRLVRWAAARSPFYRQKYHGIDLRHFELGDLPPTNKRELMAHFDDVATKPLGDT